MYSKLFKSILTSSIWSEDSDTCKVWLTLLALQDREGYVYGSSVGLARLAALPVDVVEKSLEKFINPDPYSADLTREPEREGRRVELIPGGWRLLNAEFYRDLRDEDERRIQNRAAQRRRRSASVIIGQQVSSTSASVSPLEEEEEVDVEKEEVDKIRYSPLWGDRGGVGEEEGDSKKIQLPVTGYKPTEKDVLWANSRASRVDAGYLEWQTGKFNEYWINGKGSRSREKKKTIRAWHAAWRNWIENSIFRYGEFDAYLKHGVDGRAATGNSGKGSPAGGGSRATGKQYPRRSTKGAGEV